MRGTPSIYVRRVGSALVAAGVLAFTATWFVPASYRVHPDLVAEGLRDHGASPELQRVVAPVFAEQAGELFRRDALRDLVREAGRVVGTYKAEHLESDLPWLDEDGAYFSIAAASGDGVFWQYRGWWTLFIFGSSILGALILFVPRFFEGEPGIKHDGIFFRGLSARGWAAALLGIWLMAFYVLLYFRAEWIPATVSLASPVTHLLKGRAATRWDMYGLLYTLAVLVMGLRMFAKYRHSRYHQVRTASIILFQVLFAFLLPSVLYRLNLPEVDLKNAWPLNYYFFFDWNIDKHLSAGTAGAFIFGWGVFFSLIAVPLLTYWFGKRWYCSWVCGCGGLAETLGDPFRQLSDRSLRAWRIERVLIHGVLVFAVVMSILTLSTYVTGQSSIGGLNSYTLREAYGFFIGSIFAGVVGTGFYPLMGNRVWCRFGCPLAAWMGIVQRFKSRFRITTNGGQCISCGNCSTYCEMGIDVRGYAQRGENVVRASCVGCGVCAAVCPRGVLTLENGPSRDRSTARPENALPIVG